MKKRTRKLFDRKRDIEKMYQMSTKKTLFNLQIKFYILKKVEFQDCYLKTHFFITA